MATPNNYDVGDAARVTGRFFLTETENPADPDTVTIKVRQPDGTTLTGAVIHDDLGVYHADFPITQSGWHDTKALGTGAVQAAASGGFTVRHQVISG